MTIPLLFVVACCTGKAAQTCPTCPELPPPPTMCEKVTQDWGTSLACGAEFIDAIELTGSVMGVFEHNETGNMVLQVIMEPGYKSLHRYPGRFMGASQLGIAVPF